MMFKAEIYRNRREKLRKRIGRGVIVLPGNEESPMNYPANTYAFRQDSTFLYFFGLDSPGLAGILDADEGQDILFGDDIGLEDIIWMGYLPTLKKRALSAGVRETGPLGGLAEAVGRAKRLGRPVHYLPPYRRESSEKFSKLLEIKEDAVKPGASLELIRAVVDQRLVKSEGEIAEIESALEASREMFLQAMRTTRPGALEQEIAGRIEGIALSKAGGIAFPVILSQDGQILHNHDHSQVLKKGRLMVVDAGAQSKMRYASDITRTLPVGGRFASRQKDVYETVLEAQTAAIRAMKPGVLNRDVHFQAARVVASRMKDIGLMKGDTDEAVSQGAHALFFPHGIGHQMGLDVHDMESLGEDNFGYDEKIKRSTQFGLAYLRFARDLRPGYVMTVEPGVYFISPLVAKWKKERRHRDFIRYDKVESFLDFGGIRIEDDVLITGRGNRVLGKPIPKTVREVERAMAG